MKRYEIEIVRVNDTRLFGTYETKEQGRKVGKSYAQALAGASGVVTLIYADFNEHNERTSNECRIFDIWDIPKEA